MDLHISLAQLKPYIANSDKNLKRIIDVVEDVYKENSDLVIFPELFLPGYYSKDLIYRLAESRNSSRIRRIRELAKEHNIYIITGFAEREERFDLLYNSALLATPDDDIKIYRKMHLPDFSVFNECRYFRRWDGDIELWDIKGFKTGMMICYDMFYPEVSRAYAYMGAKLLIAISATPDFSRPLFHILVQARAIENTAYFIWVNNVGTFDGIGFAGGSRVVTPLGSVVYDAPLIKEVIKTIDIDMETVKLVRDKRPIMKDVSLVDIEIMRKGFLLNKP